MPVAADTAVAADPEVPVGLPPAGVTRAVHAKIEPLFKKLGELCSLPAVAQQVLRVANDPTSDADDLVAVIEQDPAVALRLMQVVNSAYCGLRNPASDLKTAVTMLGLDRVRNLALTVSIGSMFGRDTPVGTIDPERLWNHSVCVATASRMLAARGREVAPDEAYLVGLLHDIGLLFISQHLTKLVPRVMVRAKTGLSLQEAEQEIMAFDHAQVGAYAAWRSGLPARMVAAIDHHHDPLGCPEEGRTLARTVAVANYLTTRYGHGSLEGRRLPAPPEGVLISLGLDLQVLRHLWAELPGSLANVSALACR